MCACYVAGLFFFFFKHHHISSSPKAVGAVITLFIGKERKAQSQALNPGHLMSWLDLLSALHEGGAADTRSLKPACFTGLGGGGWA